MKDISATKYDFFCKNKIIFEGVWNDVQHVVYMKLWCSTHFMQRWEEEDSVDTGRLLTGLQIKLGTKCLDSNVSQGTQKQWPRALKLSPLTVNTAVEGEIFLSYLDCPVKSFSSIHCTPCSVWLLKALQKTEQYLLLHFLVYIN